MKETTPKTFVFVLMPFSEQFNDIYELGIKAACQNVGAYCERIDEQIFVENILERVYNEISKADVIVAEMTGRNPNVFYETGYAHALNKRVILLTQNAEDIPFDLKHYPHIIYSGKIALLKSQLEARVQWCIDNPQESLAKADVNLDFYVEGVELKDKPDIVIEMKKDFHPGGGYSWELSTSLDIHNSGKRTADPRYFDVALVMHTSVEISSIYGQLRSKPTRLPDGRLLYNLQIGNHIFPDGWHNFNLPLTHRPSNELRECAVRLFTEFGAKDYPFRVRVRRTKDRT